MADSQIEEIKNKLNVVDVIGGYMKLTKTGINYRGVCPFHSEKKPSFFVSPTRQMWHCFGCGKGFSVFDFVMAIEGIEFGDALRILANKAGVQLKRENVQLKTERARLYEICDLSRLFFEKQLESSQMGKEAESYLLGRGITQESLKKWRIGYSPDTWNSLTDFLIGKGYSRSEIVKAGLAIEKENNRSDSYDRFRGRIMFPVFDINSQVVGFGGRIFKQNADEIAKYINTPQTLIYDKSGLLYGLHAAKLDMRKQNHCVVTEGYTDVIMCHQAGFLNTVAASGTALTSRHLNILKRYSENLVLAFDADMAGDSATKRGINLAQEQGFNIKIIGNYLKDADPADVIVKDPSIWKRYIEEAKSIMDYYFESAFANFDKNAPEGKKEIAKIVLPPIKRLQNKIVQSHWVSKLAQMLSIKEDAIIEELAKIKTNTAMVQAPTFSKEQEVPAKPQRKKIIEERIIALVLKNPDTISVIGEDHYILLSNHIARFLQDIKKIIEQNDKVSEGEIQEDFKTVFEKSLTHIELEGEVKNFLAALALKAEAEYDGDGQEEVTLCLLQLENIHLKEKLQKISEDVKKAELEKDWQKVDTLMEEFNKLSKKL